MTTYAIQIYTVKHDAWKLSEYSLGDTFSPAQWHLAFHRQLWDVSDKWLFCLRSVLSIHNGFLYNILQLYLIKE